MIYIIIYICANVLNYTVFQSIFNKYTLHDLCTHFNIWLPKVKLNYYKLLILIKAADTEFQLGLSMGTVPSITNGAQPFIRSASSFRSACHYHLSPHLETGHWPTQFGLFVNTLMA